MQRTAEFGNCILSKLPFSAKETIFTKGEFVHDFDFKKHDYNIRTLQHVAIQTQDGPIHILNHHGHHIPNHKNGDEETLRQCGQIADYIEKLSNKVLLTGDFNLSPNSESLEKINKVLTNLCIVNNVETTRTIFTHKNEVCDYIFVSNDVVVNKFDVLDDLASDHRALIAEFN
jgi:endonuclease/exonuclease/phosphatase (EEP) superfamily protein YafD